MMNNMPDRRVYLLALLLLLATYSTEVQAFTAAPSATSTSKSQSLFKVSTQQHQLPSIGTRLFAADDDLENKKDDDEEDEDEEDEVVDTADLGDWRKFRASLIDSGLPTKEKDGEDTNSTNTAAEPTKKKTQTKKPVVAEKNKELLQQQNEKLAQEDVWAHVVPEPEVGGLLCRMPLEAQLFWGKEGFWKDRLATQLAMGFGTVHVSAEEEGLDEGEAKWQSKVACWHQTAERMVQQEIQRITSTAKVQNGILDPNDLEENDRTLMDQYLKYKETWQEICLLLSHSPEKGQSQSVVINRPISKGINKQLAQMLLEGSDGSGKDEYDYEFGDKFVQAFSIDGVVYNGGPNGQSEPALFLHGIPDLAGATEIAPGTGIYQGGLKAAVDGILESKYKPLEFRFFLGRQVLNPDQHPARGALLGKIQTGEYKPVACSRTVALKQCLSLPKPLWHEVLELCGGELKALSNVELKKRVDLK